MMPKYENVTTNSNISLQIDTNLGGSLENALSKLKTKSAFNKTTTIKNVGGIKGLSIMSTGSVNNKFEFNSMVKAQYEKKISNNGKIKTGARYANGKITLDFMVENSQGFGFGLEANATINPLELKKNGFYLVAATPLFGMQVVFKYNPVTQDVSVIIRQPLPPGNDEDKKGAADCGCSPIMITVNVMEESYILNNFILNEPIRNAPVQNSNVNYNRQTQQVDNGNVIGDVVETIGDGVVAVGQGIGNAVVTVGEAVGDVVGGFFDLFKPKKRQEHTQYAYN